VPYGGIHRIFLPKLLFYLDYSFFDGSNLFALTVTLLLHCMACGLLLFSISKIDIINRAEKMILYGLTLLFFFSTTQIYNLIYISDNQVPLSNAFAVLALWFFYRDIQQRICHDSSHFIYLSNFFLLIACLNHSSGLMAWPAIVLMMIMLRYPAKLIIVQGCLMAVLFALYISGPDPLNPNPAPQSFTQQIYQVLASTLLNLPGILKYIGLHLSSPTGKIAPLTASLITLASIIYLAHLAWRLAARKWLPNNVLLFWLSIALYVFFISLVTAYGRQVYPGSALTDRYQTLIMTYWAALLLLLYFDLRKFKPEVALLSPLLALIFLLPHQYRAANEMAWLSSRVTQAHSAAMADITDIKTVAATLSHPLLMDNKNMVAKHHNFLKQNQLGFYQHPLAKQFGQALNISSSALCPITVTSIEALQSPGHFRIKGRSTQDINLAKGLLLLNDDNKVVGLGREHKPKGEFLPFIHRSDTSQWIAYLNSSSPYFPVTLSATLKDGSHCSLAIPSQKLPIKFF